MMTSTTNKITFATALLFSLSTATFAASVTIPNTFTAGSAAIAADVNNNFTALKNSVNDNDTRINAILSANVYDYRNYLTTASSQTYKITSNINCGDKEVRSYVRTPNGANTDLAITFTETNSGTLCKKRVFRSTNKPTERLLKERDNYDIVTNTITNTYKLTSPITVRTSTMKQGISFSDESEITVTPAGGTATISGTHIQSAYASGLESVTVPAGTFNNCLKVYENRSSTNFGSQSNRVYWFCNGIGMAKMILNNDTSFKILELESTTP